jgi:hypothetical protein
MFDFDIFENSEVIVTGPGVEMLKDAVLDMAGRGADQMSGTVRERNKYGFSLSDFETFKGYSNQFSGEHGLSLGTLVKFLNLLSKYKNTQVPQYEQINKMVEEDIAKVNNVKSSGNNKIEILNNEPKVYGKIKVYFPGGLDRSDIIALNKIVDKSFENEGVEKELDQFGNYGYPRFKKFQKDNAKINTYQIHPTILKDIVDLISKKKNIEIEGDAESSPVVKAVEKIIEPKGKKILIYEKINSRYGNKLKIKFDVPYNDSPYQQMKDAGYVPRALAYSIDDANRGNKGVMLLDIDNLKNFDSVVDFLKNKNFDVNGLEEFKKYHFKTSGDEYKTSDDEDKKINQEEKPKEYSGGKVDAVDFIDLPDDGMIIKIDYRNPMISGANKGKGDFIKETIRYTFPDYQWDKLNYRYVVNGNYNQYASFQKIMDKFNYETDKLKKLIDGKVKDNKIEKQKYYGQFDGEEGYKKISQEIEEGLPESSYELYKQQKEGVAFLYGRDHAILGDATGVGKTVQLITAAALRMKTDNKPTLIITLKATQNQWVETIVSVCGKQEKEEISTDGTNPKKWTVLYYENFSAGKALPQVVEKCKSAGFGIAILDELHKLKHNSAIRSKNVASVLETIPTVWGASATVSANKPIDVKNQLSITGHHLGNTPLGRFKQEFAGYRPTGYQGAYEEGSEEDVLAAAENLNKWLNLSGVYVRRTKDDIRDMPDLNREEIAPIQIDGKEFEKEFQNKILTYKDPENPLSQLIAAREVVARQKTDETTQKVLNIVERNKNKSNPAASKVVVFTNFIESAKQLVNKIGQGLKQIDPNYRVLTYLSDTKKIERNMVKKIFTDDPDAKVLVMSMKMGGTGIDFPNASQNMVINDFDWTPESAEQSEGRIYRINTNHPVNINYTIANGIDKIIYEKVQKKRKLAEIVQKYRRDYLEKDHDPETLKKLVATQKEINALDKQMDKEVASELAKINSKKTGKVESFLKFFKTCEFFENFF